MSGFFAGDPLHASPLEELRRRRAAENLSLIDLTDVNPTLNGYNFPENILRHAATKYFPNRTYAPSPHGIESARDAVVSYYAMRPGDLPLTRENIFITSSTSEAYRFLFSLLAEPGDSIAAPIPGYPLIDYIAQDSRLAVNSFSLSNNSSWALDSESLANIRDGKTKALCIISPHNPTGAVLRERVESIAQCGLPIIADEVFVEFSDEQLPPVGALYPELPVFHLNGISKMFALPDLKLGWIALNDRAHEQYGARLEMLNDLYLSANQLSQSILPELFLRGLSFTGDLWRDIRNKQHEAAATLQTSEKLSVDLPSAGIYLVAKLPPGTDDEQFAMALLDKGAYAHPGYLYGYESEPCLVISCMLRKDLLLEGCQIVAALADEL